ncbi:hypothetical protein C7B76_09010 [filamentous cyanobacterium CCP2]|jgi:hypothetical protein|nr:hypothetical protein C7B76_09010 [filamentous cyanobacterium CCP2]
MAARRADQKQIRITVNGDVYSLLKRIAGLKESSMNKVIGESIDRYLESEDIREMIDRHRLEDEE